MGLFTMGMGIKMNEFSMIERYFVPLTMGQAGTAGLQDDGAVVSIPSGHELVVSSDTLNERVHFMMGASPEHIARKALRVNLSDLASMGASPICYQLNIAFPFKPDEEWLASFCGALLEDNQRYGVYCSGGDTTSIKADTLSISITVMGSVPRGQAVRRGGAKEGDVLILTNPIGDAALGLQVLLAGSEGDYVDSVERYFVPQPRVGMETILQKYAHAAADVSDGLIADSSHIAKASGLGMRIDLNALVFSKSVVSALGNGRIKPEEIVCGGDDYELILAVSAVNREILLYELKKHKLNPMVIGEFTDKALGINIIGDNAYRINDSTQGWQHF